MKSKTFVFDGGTATRVDPTTLETDQEALKKKIGVRNYNRITKVVIDKKLLEANIAAGFIDPQDVADCSEVIPKASSNSQGRIDLGESGSDNNYSTDGNYKSSENTPCGLRSRDVGVRSRQNSG